MCVLVTGATGFVGRALLPVLADRGYGVRAAVRRRDAALSADAIPVGDIDGRIDWSAALAGVDCVVHLAARVHVMDDTSADPMAEFRRVNVAGTERLAKAASRAGVRRLVYLSSIKVNGERTGDTSFSEEDTPAPEDAYGVSKWEAEQVLDRVARDSGLEVVVLRPPLIYGPGVKANFRRVMDITASGVPLPFGNIRNRRSFLFVGNLVGAILRCVDHPEAKGKTFLVSDGEDLSTPDLIRKLASAMRKPTRLYSVPTVLLRVAAAIIGRGGEMARLIESLQVDSGKIRSELGWRPPFTVDEGMCLTVAAYLAELGQRHLNQPAAL